MFMLNRITKCSIDICMADVGLAMGNFISAQRPYVQRQIFLEGSSLLVFGI